MKKILQNFKIWITYLFKPPYLIVLWFLVALVVIIGIIILLTLTTEISTDYKEIGESIYPEIYGLLFDVILFGVIMSIYQIAIDRNKAIGNEEDQIDDFRRWESTEASHRIIGSIKRLNRLKVYNIDLNSCYFKDVEINNLCFEDSMMTGLTILDSKVFNTTFYNIKSNIITCRKSSIAGCSFQKGKIKFNLHNTVISSTLFQGIDISSASFYPTDLSFILFDNVNFSNSFFKFKKCHYVEFVDCIFDDCIVDEHFFKELSDPKNYNLGYQKIERDYDLILGNRDGINNPVYILRSKTKGKIHTPEHKIETVYPFLVTDPWRRMGRCQPNFELFQELE